MGKHSLLLVSTKQCVMAVFLIDMTQCCGEESEAAEEWAGLGSSLGVEAQPVQALPGVTHQLRHDARVKHQGPHHLVQFSKELFLFSRELFCLFPDFSGIEEVRGDLDVAGSHLMDALRDRHRGPAP